MTQGGLPACRHRGAMVAPGRWICESPKLVVPGRVVRDDACRHQCCYVDHPLELGNSRKRELPSPEMSVEEFWTAALPSTDDFPSGWQHWEVAQVAHRQRFHEASQRQVAPFASPAAANRGIVIGAGGPVYFACAWVCVSVLRELGCSLPVELWHIGPEELDDEMRGLAAELDIVCRDATKVAPAPRRLGGWELKPFSILHSEFAEVCYLDADNVPARNPEYLFDSQPYVENGALFWPDLEPKWTHAALVSDLAWDVAGVSHRYGPAFESGQLLVHKGKCWNELTLTMHLNEHSDFWYRYVYGDKDTFKLAWHKLQRQYAMPTRASAWRTPAIFQYDLDGELVFTHACQGKEALRVGTKIPALPQATAAAHAAQQLQARWSQGEGATWNPRLPVIRRLVHSKACLHRGSRLAPPKNGWAEHDCDIHARCCMPTSPTSPTARPSSCDHVPSCLDCGDVLFAQSHAPSLVAQVHGLGPARHLNGSLAKHEGRTLLAYRRGWDRARIWIADLDRDGAARAPRPVRFVDLPDNVVAVEDPRLFHFRGELHIAYSGVEGEGDARIVSVYYSRLRGDVADRSHRPEYPGRQLWEKNWQFFEFQEELHAVYRIAPHVVMKLEAARVVEQWRTAHPLLWQEGLPRGGAAPVLRGNEYYCFFHGFRRRLDAPPVYTMGCYTFASVPPFPPQRITQQPLLAPHPSEPHEAATPPCVYPCGAIHSGRQWHVSYGYFDREVRVATFDDEAVEASLIDIPRL